MKSLLLSGLILFSQLLFSQIDSFETDFTPGQTFSIQPCDTSIYLIDFFDGHFDEIEDTVYLTTDSNDIQFIDGTSLSADINTSITGDSLILTNITSNIFELEIEIHFPCSYINVSTYAYDEIFLFSSNQGHTTSIEQEFIVNSPYLTLDEEINTNASTDLFTNVDRQFCFINTSATPFNGVLHFVDTLANDMTISLTNFDTIYHENSAGLIATEINRVVSDSIIEIWIEVENMGSADTIKIVDVAKLVGCLGVYSTNDQTNYFFEFGCNENDLCKKIDDPSAFNTRLNFDVAYTPAVTVTHDKEHGPCFADTLARVVSFKNTGTGNADGIKLFFGILTDGAYQLSDIELPEVKAYLNVVDPANEIIMDLTVSGPGSGYTSSYNFSATNIIAPGDSVIVTYNETFECLTVEDDERFNGVIGTHSIVFQATLTHPCLPVTSPFGSLDFTHHRFSMPQEFYNLVGLMGDAQTEWMEIETSSTLELGRFDLNQVAYDPENLKLNFLISLERGLKFTSLDSIEFVNPFSGTVLTPDAVTYEGLSSMVGNGDTIAVSFSIPPSFFAPYTGPPAASHDMFETTDDFTEFFVGSRLRFNVCGVCEYSAPDGVADISQKSYLQLNPDCSDCIIPLSSVQDYTNINCPGCLLPGWNMTRFDIHRQNFGFKDTNDNHYPDTYPLLAADSSEVNVSKISLGDTVSFILDGFISDGEAGDLDTNGVADGATFASIGFDFTEGRIRMTNTGITDFEFLGGTGEIKISGTYYPFTIPEAAGEFTIHDGNDAFIIPMGTDDLISYGVASFIAYDATNLIKLNLDFRLKENPTSGSGSNPYKSVYPITCFYDIAGNPFDIPAQFIDANDHVDSIVGLSPEERKNFMYWCTANEGRYIGQGTDFGSFGNSAGYYEASACLKNIQGSFYGFVAHEYEGGQVPPSAGNAYEYELRDFWRFDTAFVTYPSDYEVNDIVIYHYNPIDDPTNVTIFGGVNNRVYFNYPLADATITDTTVEFYPHSLFSELTDYDPAPHLGGYDETKRYYYIIKFAPRDCQNLPDSTMHDNSSSQIKISNVPYGTGADTLIESSLLTYGGDIASWDNPNPIIDVAITSGGILSGNEIGWDLSLSTQATTPTTSIIRKLNNTDRRAENTFIYLQSPSGNLTNLSADNLIRYVNATPNAVASFDEGVIAGDTLYGIGPLGGNYSQILSASVSIGAEYDCSSIAPGEQDSVYVIYGWNCFEYPTNIDSACFADTLVLYFNTPVEGLQTSNNFPETITICETESLSIEFDPTGVSSLDSVSVMITGFGDLLNLENFSSSVSIAGAPTVHSLSDDTLIVQVDSLYQYNPAMSTFTVDFDYEVHCDTDFDSLIFSIDGYNLCGADLVDVTYSFSPTIEGAVIDSDIDSITITTLIDTVASCDSIISLSLILNNTSGIDFENQTLIIDFANNVESAISDYTSTISGSNDLSVIYDDLLMNGETDTLILAIELDLIDCGSNEFSVSYTVMDTVTCFGDTCIAEISPFVYDFDFYVESSFTGYDAVLANHLCEIDGQLILVSEGNETNTDISIYDTETGLLLDDVMAYDWASDSIHFDIPLTTSELTVTTSQCACTDTLLLSLGESLIDTNYVSISGCDSAIYESITYTMSGLDTLILTNTSGCDSLIFLDVTINTSEVINDYVIHCDETSCYADGDGIDTVLVSTHNMLTAAGCDSIVNNYIIIVPVHSFTEEITSCEPITWRDMPIDTTGVYADTLTSIYGCDSIIKLDFILSPEINISNTINDCGFVITDDGNIYYNDTTIINTFVTEAGCDSIITTIIDIADPDTLSYTASACDYYIWNTDTLNVSGNYHNTYTNEEGCPEVEALTLTIYNSYSSTESITTCHEYIWYDSLYTVTTIDSMFFTTENGCDSIYVLDLTVEGYDTIDVHISACEEYEWHDSTYTTSGDYYEYFPSPTDCGRVEILHLTIFNPDTNFVNQTVCDSIFYDGYWIHESGVYYSTYTDTNDCMSTEQLTLTVIDLDNTVTASESEFVSNEEFASYQWIMCDPVTILPGETNQNFTAIEEGKKYAVIVQNGPCTDTSACIDWETAMNISKFDLIELSITPNPSNGNVFITHQDDDFYYNIKLYDPIGKLIYEEQGVHETSKQIVLPEARGLYLILLTDQNHAQREFKIIRQ